MKKNMQHPGPTQAQTIPHPLGNDPISVNTKYYKIEKAAEILNCSADDIVHLGSLGKMEVMAPVLSSSIFEWPVGAAGIPFPALEKPFHCRFNVTDRVILSKFDLASIEAIGKAVPHYFFLPSKAREAIRDLEDLSLDGMDFLYEEDKKEEEGKTIGSIAVFKQVGDFELTDEEITRRELSYHSPWHKVSPDDNPTTECMTAEDPAITIENLFISKEEIIRIMNGLPQEKEATKRSSIEDEIHSQKNINYLNRHASAREPIWTTAIYCLTQMQGRKISAAELAKNVEKAAVRLYPESGALSLSLKTIEAHLSSAIAGRTPATKKPPE